MEIKRLYEVCDFQNGFAFKSSRFKPEGLPILRISNIQNNSISTKDLVFFDDKDYREDFERYKVLKGDILIAMSGGTTGKLGVNTTDTVYYLNQRVGKFSPKKNLNRQYLYYFLHTKSEESLKIAGGAAQPNLSTEQIKNFQIPIPPLSEQQAIVEKLDTAFDLIDRAKANIEQNIQNAKELFQSKLNQVFSQKGEGWEQKKLQDTFKLKSGDGLTSKQMISNAEFPVYGGNNIVGYYNKFNFEYGVIVGRVGALCGNARFINEKVWITDNAFKLCDFKFDFNFKYLTYLLNYKNLRSYARQAAQPVISNSSLKDVVINFPKSIETQQKIVSQLDELSAQTNQLQQKYQQKLANLEELKKSILEKVFKGELV